ncbi:HelD family protein [Clostridium oceanicum]|uniref:AAA family ATPase n=1 Tax=Clostridium oceanicum TaxID=1543 RepID=A0ABN1JAA9_9CLOT
MDVNEKNDNLYNQIELAMEKEHLDFVISEIRKGVLNHVEKRKELINYILEHRKKNIEEYRDDEDEVAEYFDHDIYLKEKLYNYIEAKLRELTILEKDGYFGKVVFEDEKVEDNIYIGRFGFSKEGDYKPLVVDWRAPICKIFYEGRLGNIEYSSPDGEIELNVKSKRQYVIKNGKLEGMFDSDLDVKDELLKEVLSKNATDKLKDIVMTIQKEQDEIIRQPRDKTVVVNGVAGSGKTTVALHRVAYLLYNYRKEIQDNILILGPNNVFIDYISNILPSLGENGVKQTTFLDFVSKLVNIPDILSSSDYMEKIVSNNIEFINKAIHKQSEEYIRELDKLVERLDLNYFSLNDIEFMGEIVVDKKELKEMFYNYFKYMPLFRRSKKIKRIIFSKLKDVRDKKVFEIEKKYKDKINNMTEEEIKLEGNNLEFSRKNDIRDIIKKLVETKNSLKWLDGEKVEDIYIKFNNDKLTVDDIAPILYLKIKLEGLRLNKSIKHIVIDEAQEYSLLQFIVLKEITNCKFFTVVGDSNQRILESDKNPAMLKIDKILDKVDTKYYYLQKSYRSTKQIMEYANKFLKTNTIVPLVREGNNVVIENINDEKSLKENIFYHIDRFKQKGYENIAIVCEDFKDTQSLGELLKNSRYINLIDKEDIIYSGGNIIIPSFLTKGLEFDCVIGVNNIEYKSMHNNLNYVMATRALHELVVINKGIK